MAIRNAIDWYKKPLGEITKYSNPWGNASYDFNRAAIWVAYAKGLASKPEEQKHREAQDETLLEFGNKVSGRLGLGDYVATEIDNDAGLADRYRLEIDRLGELQIAAHGGPCDIRLVLTDSSGKKITAKDEKINRKIGATGTYHLFVSSRSGPGVYDVVAYIR
jgi:hypothetical protein